MERLQLQDWFNANMPNEEKLSYARAAKDQICWVRDILAFRIWNSLADFNEFSYEQIKKTLTVDGTHTSKSVLLPVYRFDIKGVVIKLRGNFYDWCVRCNVNIDNIPNWVTYSWLEKGFFEGMTNEDNNLPTSFCVSRQEDLYAIIWLILSQENIGV